MAKPARNRKKNDSGWVPPAGQGDYTKAREKWNPSLEQLEDELKAVASRLRKAGKLTTPKDLNLGADEGAASLPAERKRRKAS